MKKIFILTFLAFRFCCSFSQDYVKIIVELDKTLDDKAKYIEQKEAILQKIKSSLHDFEASGNPRQQISVSLDLVYEYQSYVYDSAQHYVNEAKRIAYQLKDAPLISRIKIREGFVLLSSGLFKEALDTLNSVNPVLLNDSLKCVLYSTLARAYYDIADYVRDSTYMPEYISRGNRYIDMALALAKPKTNEFWAIKSLQRIKESDWNGAKYIFEYWINNYKLPRHYYAIATSSLGYIYQVTGYPDQAIKYFGLAAIADVKTATMETVALRNLANLFYEKGDQKRAYRYITEALNQASYYNARHRQLEVGQILPIIERDRMNTIKKQKDRITNFSYFISVLLVALIVALVVILISFRRLNIARIAIRDANEKLTEANKIKDEYIAEFFNQNSEYIEKIEHLQKWFNRMVVTKQFEALRKSPEYINIQNERDVLYERFDRMFLKLFPDFVQAFNKLLVEGEQIQVKDDQLMNVELRIYALIRLGINDNEKIASFLNYSVNTIYTYKTKIKGKARGTSDEFKRGVMEIKSI
jgi:DNA-binding CsgD family transcriptional regulator